MQLTEQQQRVLGEVMDFLHSDAPVFILRGYAGTGKTTLVKTIVETIRAQENLGMVNLLLMAPTGRAARVLEGKAGYPASTIHKAIYADSTLEVNDADDVADLQFKLHFSIAVSPGRVVAIVDEASMLTSCKSEHELFTFGTDNLMDDLLTYVRPSYGGKVIFVGDPAQLPPVGDDRSCALDAGFFQQKGLRVVQAELTEVLRQDSGSAILSNAMQLRDLLGRQQRNRLVFEEKPGQVEALPDGGLLSKYLEAARRDDAGSCVLICYTNRAAADYNRDIREGLFGIKDAPLRAGDVLMVVQNNYALDIMNGEFVTVQEVGGIDRQSAPVYVQEGGSKVRRVVTMEFVRVAVATMTGNAEPLVCLLSLDLLRNGNPSLGVDEQRALYVNFCMRHPGLKPGTEEFKTVMMNDPYYNCLKAKFGYAVTGHKCQGGEWSRVFVDYDGRTGLSDSCLRWNYTATTRARDVLYFTNLPHITPFSRFRIEPVQQCSRVNEECRVIGRVDESPFHAASAPDYLKAKSMCIRTNMEGSPYRVVGVDSKQYLEVYHISTPTGDERYDIWYKKGGIFLKAAPQRVTANSVLVCTMLDDEHAMPLVFDYEPSDATRAQLYGLVRSACDSLGIVMTNVVEHDEDYSVVYYFRTSGSVSYVKVYISASGAVTYARPMSMLGCKDSELNSLIEEIKTHFEQ